MGFWSKIKKEVSRVGRKTGMDRSSKSWTTMIGGTLAGAAAGGIVGGPGGLIAGGILGAAGGMLAGDQIDNMDAAADAAEKQSQRALELASRTEVELENNNSEEAETGMLEDERRARLAAKYSLGRTSAFSKKRTTGKTTIG